MIRHVASVSGGKDSVAMCLALTEQGIPHDRIFLDTGWEHPDLYAHLEYLETVLGPIHRVAPKLPELPADTVEEVEAIERLLGRSPSAFVRWTVRKGMFPSRMRRFCTKELKVRPFLRWVDELDEDIVSCVGIRAAESAARSRLPERELMPGAEHVEVWRPILNWSESDVIAIHARYGVQPCPLYLRGASRVGCWPCIQSNKGELAQLRTDENRVEVIRRLESLIQKRARERYAAKGVELANPPTMFQQSLRDQNGDRPCVPIDDVLTWAATNYGGRQMALDVSWGKESGCVRWGMCEGRNQ